MFFRLIRFIRHCNPWRFWFPLIALVIYAALTLVPPLGKGGLWSWLSWLYLVPAKSHYWFRLLPIAQFAGATSLAYMALDFFRHTKWVNSFVRRFFRSDTEEGKPVSTTEDTRGLAGYLADIKMSEQDTNRQLIILTRVFELCEARACWLSREKNCQVDGMLLDLNEAVKATKNRALTNEWFMTGTGRTYLKDFHTGWDWYAVATGLALCLLVHVLASIEDFHHLWMPSFFDTAAWGWVQILTILAIGCLNPLWYVMHGRTVIDELHRIGDLGREQFVLRKREIRNRDLQKVNEARAHLHGQPAPGSSGR